MQTIKITLAVEQLKIVDHFANAMGMTREEAAGHFLLNDALDWYAKVMLPAERAKKAKP